MFHSDVVTHAVGIDLYVSDLERLTRFYNEVIGLKHFKKSKNEVVFNLDRDHFIRLIEDDSKVKPSLDEAGLFHVAILLPERSDLADFLVHIHDKGIQLGASDHLVSEAIYLSDPEGNGIEIYVDRDHSQWIWNNDSIAMETLPLDVEDLLSVQSGNQFDGLPSSTIIGHIHLKAYNVSEMNQFYHEHLGFNEVATYGGQASFMSDANYHHHLAVNTWQSKEIRNDNTSGLAKVYFNRSDFETMEHTDPSNICIQIN